jgi:hypothetical protein
MNQKKKICKNNFSIKPLFSSCFIRIDSDELKRSKEKILELTSKLQALEVSE